MSGDSEKAKKFFRRRIMLSLLGWGNLLLICAIFLMILAIIWPSALTFSRGGGIVMMFAGVLSAVYHITVPLVALNIYAAIFMAFINITAATVGLGLFIASFHVRR